MTKGKNNVERQIGRIEILIRKLECLKEKLVGTKPGSKEKAIVNLKEAMDECMPNEEKLREVILE